MMRPNFPARSTLASPRQHDETFAADDRASLRPAQEVERRLISLLRGSPVFVSQVQQTLRPSRN